MPSNQARVFVLNSAGHDFTAALQFTDEPLIVLTEGNVSVFQTDRLQQHLVKQMADFTVDDYLLITGTPVLALLAALVITENLKLERFNVLLWSAFRQQYIRRTVVVNGGAGGYSGAILRRTVEATSGDVEPEGHLKERT